MLKLQTALNKLKCRILGISYNTNLAVDQTYNRPIKLLLSSGIRSFTSQSEFSNEIVYYDYEALIELKSYLLKENTYQSEIVPLLHLTNLQIAKLQKTYYTDKLTHGPEDLKNERNRLETTIKLIRRHILILNGLSRLEKKMYSTDNSTTKTLTYILQSMGGRILSLDFEEKLPVIIFPSLHLYKPNQWISKIEQIVLTSKDPYLATLYIRLKLERSKKEELLVHFVTDGEDGQGPKQFFRTYPIKEYKKRVDKLIEFVNDKKNREERNLQINKLKKDIVILNEKKLERWLIFMIKNNLISLDPKDIDWFLYSMSSNSKTTFQDEFPANLFKIESKDAILDFRASFRYLIAKKIIDFNAYVSVHNLIPLLITCTVGGNSSRTWKETLKGAKGSSGYFQFRNKNVKFLNFHEYIQ